MTDTSGDPKLSGTNSSFVTPETQTPAGTGLAQLQPGYYSGQNASGSSPYGSSLGSQLNTAGVATSQLPNLQSSLNVSQSDQDAIRKQESDREAQLSGVIQNQYGEKISNAQTQGQQQIGGAKSQLGESRGLGFSSSRSQYITNLQKQNNDYIKQIESDRDNALTTLDTQAAERSQTRIDQLRDQQFKLAQEQFSEGMQMLQESRAKEATDKAITTVSPGESIYDPKTGAFTTAPGATTTNQKDYEYYVQQEKTSGKTPLSFDEWQTNAKAPAAIKEYNAAKAGGFTGTIMDYQLQKKGGGATLDADTIQFMADQYVASPGSAIPSFGMGAPGMAMRAQFYKAVADTAEAKGLTGQALAARKAGATAAQSALTKMTTLTAATSQAEKAATSNLDLAYKLGEVYDRTGYPSANRFQNWIAGQVGDKDLSAFETALYTGAREYAKVASGAAGSVSGLTDSATKEAEKLVNTAMTQGQLKSTLDTMKLDMQNVKDSQSSILTSLQDQISTGVNVADQPPSSDNTSGDGWF